MRGVHNFWGRVLIVIVLCVVGLLFPLTFILAAIVAYSMYSDVQDLRNGKTPATPPVIVPFYDQESDYTWQERSDFRTESVAEQAFLKAMVGAFDLKPDGDDLAGNGIRFAFQREILRYRVDFILNDWLIVEIDGAEWHSSPEAVERDGIRDAALRELDYSILRIPAKIVFKTPAVAIGRVKDALKKPTTPITVIERDRRQAAARPKVAVGTMVMNAVKSIGTSIDTLDEFVSEAQRKSKITSALTQATITFETERTVIENAIDSAKRQLALQKEFQKKPGLKELYEASYKELDALMKGVPETKSESVKIAYVAPMATGDAEIDAIVRLRYDELLLERKKYIGNISNTLKDYDFRHMVIIAVSKVNVITASEIAQRHSENIYQHILEDMTLKSS